MRAAVNVTAPFVNVIATGSLYPAGGAPAGDIGPRHFAFIDEDGGVQHAIAMGLMADNKERAFDEQIIWAIRESGRIDDGLWRQLTTGDLNDQWQALYFGSLQAEGGPQRPDRERVVAAAFGRYHSPGFVGRSNLLAGDQANPLRPDLAQEDRLDLARRFLEFEGVATVLETRIP